MQPNFLDWMAVSGWAMAAGLLLMLLRLGDQQGGPAIKR
jgi:hypothetical protein